MAEKTRYSDAELEEFRAIIMEKLELAQRDYDRLKSSIMNKDGNDTDDTSPTYKVLEEGANTLSKEETTRLAARQLKFIQGLQAAHFQHDLPGAPVDGTCGMPQRAERRA